MSIGKVINIKHRENCSITDAEREMDLAISELKKYFAFTGRDDWLGNDCLLYTSDAADDWLVV